MLGHVALPCLWYERNSHSDLLGLSGSGVSGKQQYKTGGEGLYGKPDLLEENFRQNREHHRAIVVLLAFFISAQLLYGSRADRCGFPRESTPARRLRFPKKPARSGLAPQSRRRRSLPIRLLLPMPRVSQAS